VTVKKTSPKKETLPPIPVPRALLLNIISGHHATVRNMIRSKASLSRDDLLEIDTCLSCAREDLIFEHHKNEAVRVAQIEEERNALAAANARLTVELRSRHKKIAESGVKAALIADEAPNGTIIGLERQIESVLDDALEVAVAKRRRRQLPFAKSTRPE
jgi:hypothetical protein